MFVRMVNSCLIINMKQISLFYAEFFFKMRKMRKSANYADPHHCILSDALFKDDKHRKLLERVVNLENTVKTLELKNNALKAQLNTTISKVKENVVLLDEQEQYMRRECVEIKGIPVSRNENTNEVVKQVAGSRCRVRRR